MAGGMSQEAAEKKARLERTLGVASATFLASSLVHGLSQPLSAINSWSAVCRMRAERDKRIHEQIGEKIALLAKEAERATAMLRSFKELPPRTNHRFISVDLTVLLSEMARLLREDASECGATIRIEMDDEICKVTTDPELIEMVVYVLCRNSLDAVLLTPGPQRHVIVRTRTMQTSVGVFISDTGPGIDERVLTHLFEPLVTSKPYGVGIGLALCRSTIESLGGRIWLETQSGEGTTFAFQLPCEPANISE